MPPLSMQCSVGSSFRLATILGIRVGVNVSWFLVLFLFIFWFRSTFTDILGDQTRSASGRGGRRARLSSARSCCTSSGHALAARREGIEVTGIDLFFFGGVMKMSRDTRLARPGVPRRGRRAGW